MNDQDVDDRAPGLPDDDNDEPAKVTLFTMEPADRVKRLRQWLRESAAHKAEIRKRRKRDFEFYAGEQWDESDKARADALKKPMLVLNLMLSIIGAIIGEERENRQEIKLFGTNLDDEVGVEVMNKIIKWVMTACGGEFQLSEMFESCAICGEGWTGVDVDYFEDPDGRIVLEHVDDDEMFPDPSDMTKTATGGRFMIRTRMWAEDEIEAKWSGAIEKLMMSSFGIEPGSEPDTSMLRDIYDDRRSVTSTDGVKLFDKDTRRWAICEALWWQIEPGVVVSNPDTQLLEEYSPEEFAELKAKREQEIAAAMAMRTIAAQSAQVDPSMLPPVPGPIDAIERPIKCFYRSFFCNDEELEVGKSELVRLKRFKYVPLRGLRNKAKREFFGWMRPAIDPQIQHNVEQSVIVQLEQLMPKASWMGPKGSFHNRQDWITKLAQPGALLEYSATRGKPEQIQSPPIPRHLMDMAMMRPEMVRSITGVNHELTGERAGSNTGVVIDKRQKAARTVLTILFDNYRETKIEIGKILVAYIQHYVKPGRILRIVGPEGKPEGVQMTQEAGFAKFDVMVDESDSNVNERFEALHVLQTTLPQLAKAGMPLVPEFVDLLPLPTALRDRWKTQISWEMTLAGRLPPVGWKAGMPLPPPPGPPGMPPAPGAAPAPVPVPA